VLYGDSGSYQAAFASYSQSGSITAALFWRGSLALSFLIPVRAVVLLFNPIPPIYFFDYHIGSESANVIYVILLLPFVLERLRQAVVRKQPGHLGYLLPLILGLCVVSALLPISSPRFLVPIMPYYMIWAAQGIVYCKRRWRVTYLIWLIGLGLAAGVLYTGFKLIL
jgi:predicted ABC-type exoprotein transport system permease subunit